MARLTKLRAQAAARVLGMTSCDPYDAFELRWGKVLAEIEAQVGYQIWGWIAERGYDSELIAAVFAAQHYQERARRQAA